MGLSFIIKASKGELYNGTTKEAEQPAQNWPPPQSPRPRAGTPRQR